MDHSLKSSKGKAVPTNSKNPSCDHPEESGWTTYFEDFSQGIEPSYCSTLDGSSLLSDAASCAAWNISHHHNNNHNNVVSSFPHRGAPNLPNKLTFKKKRTEQISDDDPLEDTASSPVNSPKVRDLSPTDNVSRKIDNDQLQAGSVGKGFTSLENHSDLQQNDKHETKFNGKNIDCTDLKKRGLCLVLLSLLVNYMG